MARKKKEEAPVVAEVEAPAPVVAEVVVPEPVKVEVPEGPYDANAALYKDRSGASTKDVQSEGAANFAFHTAQARSESQ